MGFVTLLMPFVWVLDVDSCGHAPVATEFTGLELVKKLDVDAWALVLPVLLVCVATPLLAVRLAHPVARLVTHLVGLVAAGFGAYAAVMVLFFTVFTHRTARGVGWLVLSLFAGSLLDALLRVAWAVQEWLAQRRESRARANL